MAKPKKSQSFNAPPPDVEPEVVPEAPVEAVVRICPTDKSRSFTNDRCDTCGATWREA